MARIHQNNDNPERVLLRYHGGKARLAKRINEFFPPHRVYVEAYGGGASVLLNKPRKTSVDEVYNDKDSDVVNLFECLSDDRIAPVLLRRLALTPYAREAWERAYMELAHLDVVERARTLCVRVMMGWGSKGLNPDAKVVFRANDASSGYGQDWNFYVDNLPAIVERLRGVTIENEEALDVVRRNDSAETLHYLDPPYLLPKGDKTYAHDMDQDQHEVMLIEIQRLQGFVLLSGYPSELYQRHLGGKWYWTQWDNYTDSHAKRTDCLWMNERTADYWMNDISQKVTPGDLVPAAKRRVARVVLAR